MPGAESDADEFDAFVAAEGAALSRLAWVVAGGREQGEDLVQDTLVKAWRHWKRVRASNDARSYVRRILLNTHRTNVRFPRREVSVGDLDSSIVESPYQRVDLRLALEQALRRLPPKQRAVIALRYLEQRSEQEVADLMGCSPGTVKSHTSRAMSSLRRSPVLSDLAPWSSHDE